MTGERLEGKQGRLQHGAACKRNPCSMAQVHVTLGHSTVVAEALYFGTPDGTGQEPAAALSAMIGRIGQLALNVRPPIPLWAQNSDTNCRGLLPCTHLLGFTSPRRSLIFPRNPNLKPLIPERCRHRAQLLLHRYLGVLHVQLTVLHPALMGASRLAGSEYLHSWGCAVPGGATDCCRRARRSSTLGRTARTRTSCTGWRGGCQTL